MAYVNVTVKKTPL